VKACVWPGMNFVDCLSMLRPFGSAIYCHIKNCIFKRGLLRVFLVVFFYVFSVLCRI
jgi:hypothetical protein